MSDDSDAGLTQLGQPNAGAGLARTPRSWSVWPIQRPGGTTSCASPVPNSPASAR